MALLQFFISKKPNYIILDNIFDSLDVEKQKQATAQLYTLSKNTLLIQIVNRKQDCLPFIKEVIVMNDKAIITKKSIVDFLKEDKFEYHFFAEKNIPTSLKKYEFQKKSIDKIN